MLEVLINGCRKDWRLSSIQPPMLEDSNGPPVDEFDCSDMDACYETFDKDGYVFNAIFLIIFRKTRLGTIQGYSRASLLNLKINFHVVFIEENMKMLLCFYHLNFMLYLFVFVAVLNA